MNGAPRCATSFVLISMSGRDLLGLWGEVLSGGRMRVASMKKNICLK